MENPVIFVLTTVISIRGRKQPVPYKTGFFYVSAKGGNTVLISSGPSLPSPKKGNCPAEVELLSAVIGGPLCFPAYKTTTVPHHAHRNFRAIPAQPTSHNKIPTRLANPSPIAHKPVKSFKAGHALTKDAGVATACPPAVFSIHKFLNRLAL